MPSIATALLQAVFSVVLITELLFRCFAALERKLMSRRSVAVLADQGIYPRKHSVDNGPHFL